MQQILDDIIEAIVHNSLLIGIGMMVIAFVMYLSGAPAETWLWFLFPGGVVTMVGMLMRI